MRYFDYIQLDYNFLPVFDITAEQTNYWKKFIPVKNFYNLLKEFLNSLESGDSGDSAKAKSFLIHGAYGVGKSHASSVVKHLLCDDWENIKDYVEKIEDIQLKEMLTNFRQNKKAFSIILKGASGIYDSKSFCLAIQKAVKKAFPEMTVRTDYEIYKNFVEKNELGINWNEFIQKNNLRFYVKNANELIKRLDENDDEILSLLYSELNNLDINLAVKNIIEWLKEVSYEIRNRRFANYLIIFWDESTPILDKGEPSIINELQNIAELTSIDRIYLYLISHRAVFQNQDVKKMLDRFNSIEYYMESITSYHLIYATFKKDDNFKNIQSELSGLLNSVIKKIIINNSYKEKLEKQDLENIIPIHPYTAYLLTFIARNLGSTERSIFSFIFDKKMGFIKFIEENPEKEGKKFLTADVLWDYFFNEFSNIDNDKTSPSVERYNIYNAYVKTLGDNALKIFKAVLLLNILYKYTGSDETSLVAPSENNLKGIFSGDILEEEIMSILNTIAERQYITKTIDNLYLVTASVLSHREIEDEKREIENQYKDITKILTYENKNKIIENISIQALREIKLEFYPYINSTALLINHLKRDFKEGPKINIAFFISKDEEEINNISAIVKEIASSEEGKNIVFLILKKPFDKDTFNKYSDNLARSRVSEKHNYREDSENYKNNILKIVNVWIEQALRSEVEWYLNGYCKKITFNAFSNDLNNEISPKIFTYGLENIKNCTINKNIWARKNAKKSCEIFLFSTNRQKLEEKTIKGIENYLRAIVKDEGDEYIVDLNLNFKPGIKGSNPLYSISKEIENQITRASINGVFNLGEVLSFLSKPPYGFFSNMIYFAAMGFLMRNYVDKLYESGTGILITKEQMRDKIISLFKYFEDGGDFYKLSVRLGTLEENKLIDLLKNIFNIDDVNSLNDIKWKIRDSVLIHYPLWVFYYDEKVKQNTMLRESIKYIDEFIKKQDDELKIDLIREYLKYLEQTEIDLKQLFQKKKDELQHLFYIYIKDVLKRNQQSEISESFFSKVEQYIIQNLQEEKWSYEELMVEKLILQYLVRINTPSQQPSPQPFQQHPQPPEERYNNDINLILIKKIEQYNSLKLKTVMKKFFDEYNENEIKELIIKMIKNNIISIHTKKLEKLLEEEDIERT